MNGQDSKCYATLGGRAEVRASRTEPKLKVRLVPARNTHEDRLALTTPRRDVLAGMTGLPRVGSIDLLDPAGCFLLHRVTTNPHPDLRMAARLGPALPAMFRPGLLTVPRAERVMPLTLSFSTRITKRGVPGCLGGPATPGVRQSSDPQAGRLYARSGVGGSPQRTAATPGRGRATPRCCTLCDPAASHGCEARAAVRCREQSGDN
jgi:hypothetical protein